MKDFNLKALKNSVKLMQEAAEFTTAFHCNRPVHALKNEPYESLVRGAFNDFNRLSNIGIYLIKSDDLEAVNNYDKMKEVIEEVNHELVEFGSVGMDTHSRIVSLLKQLETK